MQLRHLFKNAKLSEVIRQNEKLFIDFLNKVRVSNIDDDVEKLLNARFIHKSDENYPKDALHMYVENELAMKRNEAALNDLPSELYTIEVRIVYLTRQERSLILSLLKAVFVKFI